MLSDFFIFESEELKGHTVGTTDDLHPSLKVRPTGLTTRSSCRGSSGRGGTPVGKPTPVGRTKPKRGDGNRVGSGRRSSTGKVADAKVRPPEGGGSGSFPAEVVKTGYPEEADICRNRIFR